VVEPLFVVARMRVCVTRRQGVRWDAKVGVGDRVACCVLRAVFARVCARCPLAELDGGVVVCLLVPVW